MIIQLRSPPKRPQTAPNVKKREFLIQHFDGTCNYPSRRCGRPSDCESEGDPARVDWDDEELEDGDEVEVQGVGDSGEGPDNGDGEDGGAHDRPVGELQQLILNEESFIFTIG